MKHLATALILVFLSVSFLTAQENTNNKEAISTQMEHFGFNIGDDYQLATYAQLAEYWKKLAMESPRMILEEIGKTAEGRNQYMAIISSPENLAKIDEYKDISRKLALAKDLGEPEAKKLAAKGKAVIWIDGGLHATEVVGPHQLLELVTQFVSQNDKETLRILDDVIILAVHANPDGMGLVSGWYMRNKDPQKRSTGNLPRLYNKYVGHDNNRDSYMLTQPETENMSRIMYREWFPQIMYNHHQSGPSDIIVFVPPFRDPPNYYYDPLVVLGVESVGAAMHSRLVAEGMPGSGMRSRSTYSIWFNGNLRTTGYFHNQIGILTEIKGNPTPMDLAFYPDRQLPCVDMPFPHKPGKFYFRQAIDYSIAMDRAVLDYASRNRETLLYNRYLMGRNNIEKGSRDNWTIHPDIVDEVIAEAKKDPEAAKVLSPSFRRRGKGLDMKYYELFRKPENRDPRGYILPSDQADFATATKFVNTFIKNGISVQRATADFEVNAKKYPAGSYIFKTAQAFRPYILDLFEPQDHPNDFLYEGGPPIPPYDNAGYTLAFQMGIEFDRILDSFDGPFEDIKDVTKPLAGKLNGKADAKAYLLSHKPNDAAVVMNRLLASGHELYWLKNKININGVEYPEGTIYIKAQSSTRKDLEGMAKDLGLSFTGTDKEPGSNALQLRPVKIGLWDRYGGSMPSGWTRWLLEQYEFNFEVVYPKDLDKGKLNKRFDVIVFPAGAIPGVSSENSAFYYSRQPKDPESIPGKYRDWLGNMSKDKTIPQLIEFLENGGTIVTIGSSTRLGEHAGLPYSNHMVNGQGKALSSEEYFIPSSILEVRLNNSLPVAYGLPERLNIFFNRSPVFRFKPDADKKGMTSIAWFDSDKPLKSGWAWGQDRLYGGVAMAKADIGKGELYMFGPEILFRAQSHGTFKLFFNSLFLSGISETNMK